MKTTIFISVLAIALLFAGCASIIHGPMQAVSFTSQPPGAKISIDGIDYGMTPKATFLKRNGRLRGEAQGKKSYDVKIELEGFYPYKLMITREMDGWFIGNILLGGIIGIVIDAASGSMYKLTPNQINATFEASITHNMLNDDQLYITVAMTPDPSWEKIGELIKK